MGLFRAILGVKTRNLEITTSQELAAFRRANPETWAGVEVGVKEALKVSSWYAGNANVAEDLAKMPFILYHAREERRRATDSPYWRLVHDRWSTRWTSQQGREYMTFWARHDGDAYALKSPRGALQVRELLPFPRGEVEKDETSDGDFVYYVRLDGKKETLTRRDVFHLQGFALNDDGGADLFKMSREDIALSLATERHGATFFGNGTVPSLVVEHPGEMSDPAYERLRLSLREDHTGANAHNHLLLEEGAKAHEASATNEASQFLETRLFQVTDHARRLRLPPTKLGDHSHATFTNVEHDTLAYYVDSLLPWALRWENAYNQQIIQTNAVYAELLFDALMRADSKTRAEFYAMAIDHGWMTQNEIRRRENLPPLEGGDVLHTQLNLSTRHYRELQELKLQAEIAQILVTTGFEPEGSLTTAGLPAIPYVGTREAAVA